jgi:NAD(P)H dehydrogenase (quinone)
MNNKILIIYTHPDTDGYNKEILRVVEEKLKKEQIDYNLIDLYKIKYNAILEKEELYTKGNRFISEENIKIQNEIKQRDKLIFIYPIWWGTMPAILKGFTEKVFTPRFAYYYENKLPNGLLKEKKAFIFSSSGSPRIYNLLTFNRAVKTLTKNVLKFCGIKSDFLIIPSAFNVEKDKDKIKKIVIKKLNKFIK